MESSGVLHIAAAYIMDISLGDPHWLPHPVRGIGWLISRLERILRPAAGSLSLKFGFDRAKMERAAGGCLTLLVVSITFFAVYFLIEAARDVHPVLYHVLSVYFIYSAFAAGCLADEAKKVYRPLKNCDLPEARRRVGMLVGRETDRLDGQGVIRAVVETTAENTVDGVISPIIFAIAGSIFGMAAPAVYLFKAVSTMDSMVGYMNEKYINLGRIPAKLDDALNYIPARLSGPVISAAAFFCGRDWRGSFRIMLRDRRNHKSPNCAYPEAAVAGALGVRLGGDNVYFGKIVKKPTIGDKAREIEARDIIDTVRIMIVSSVITLVPGLTVICFIN